MQSDDATEPDRDLAEAAPQHAHEVHANVQAPAALPATARPPVVGGRVALLAEAQRVRLPGPETAVLGLLSTLRAQTKAPHQTDLLRETLRALNRPGLARTVAGPRRPPARMSTSFCTVGLCCQFSRTHHASCADSSPPASPLQLYAPCQSCVASARAGRHGFGC